MKWVVFFCLFFLAGCSCSGGRNRTDHELILDMIQQKAIKPQEGSFTGEIQMRQPPEGTRARGRAYYPYPNAPFKAAENLKNPLPAGDPEVIAKGQLYYEKFCIYCHGEKGNGKGVRATVAPKMTVKPPSLLTDKARNFSDGRIYHIIYNGQGLMGAYRIQLGANEQLLGQYMTSEGEYRGSKRIWAVVHYIRRLQAEALKKGTK